MRRFPSDMGAAKRACSNICRKVGLEITFDDQFGNFGNDWNRCVTTGKSVECSYFKEWNHDLLVFAVLHEIGHFMQSKDAKMRRRTRFFSEFDAWNKAMNLHAEIFGRNISVRQARYMMKCLNSYIPDYNDCERSEDGMAESEHSFWCPLLERVNRK